MSLKGRLPSGDFVAFSAYLMMLVRPMITLGFIVNTFERGAASMDRMNAVLNEKPEIFDGEQVKWGMKNIEGEIEFRNLNFDYPDGTPVLKDINLKIARGMTLAIVGGTGSGKSTLVNPHSTYSSSRTRHDLYRRRGYSGYTPKRASFQYRICGAGTFSLLRLSAKQYYLRSRSSGR